MCLCDKTLTVENCWIWANATLKAAAAAIISFKGTPDCSRLESGAFCWLSYLGRIQEVDGRLFKFNCSNEARIIGK